MRGVQALVALVGLCIALAFGSQGSRAEDGSPFRIRVMTFNVLHNNTDYEAFSDFVRDRKPDVVVLQEARETWISRTILRSEYPYRRASRPGILIASRLPLAQDQDTAASDLLRKELVPIRRILVDLGDGRSPLAIYGVHFTSPDLEDGEKSRRRQYPILARAVAMEPADRPVIVAGDFNDSPGKKGPLDELLTTSRLSLMAGDTAGQPTKSRGESATPGHRMGAIDQVLAAGPVEFVARTVGPDIGSDHLPVIVDLTIR